MPHTFSDKRSSNGAIESEIISKQKLAEETHKRIIKKFEKLKVYSSFKDNIWGAHLVE